MKRCRMAHSGRRSDPYLERLDRICLALATALLGDVARLPDVAAEMVRMGYGTAADNLARLLAALKK